jgi:superfamily II DNA or RNA helicase
MTIRETRAVFARCLLGDRYSSQAVSIGSIVLRTHQQTAVTRVKAAIAEFGGALVSDHVGTGKTYVALALAGSYGGAIVVAPAVLKDMWAKAASNAEVRIEFISTESLSRKSTRAATRELSEAAQLVIVDEAQHFRNRATQRFAALAHLSSQRPVVLLSATPIHNRASELQALLSLFVGSRAAALSQSELARIVIRRSRKDIEDSASMPRVMPAQWCDLTHDDEIPRLLLSLPPPSGPREGGDGGALVVHSLMRQWVSSDRALHRALVRRLQRATALVAALESGTYPTAAELGAWISGEDCVQLGFAELLAPRDARAATLLPVVRTHLSAVQLLAERVKASNARDVERATVIRELRRKHEGARIVAFSQYADTVEGLFELLANDGLAAVLTGSGARVSGGRISRIEAIERFAPMASGRKSPRPAETVTLLLTTDILSEGVNLQDASVVVHLDLPWTPARMEQRMGRVARMGSCQAKVFSYIMRPPASAETLIRTESILRSKMDSAGIVTDGLESILPDALMNPRVDNLPRVVEQLRSILEGWTDDNTNTVASDLSASATLSVEPGFIALCRAGKQYRVLASDWKRVTDDPVRLLALMRHACGAEIDFHPSDLTNALAVVTRHLQVARAVQPTGSQAHPRQLLQRAALRKISRIARDARPHERSYILPASARARDVILDGLSAGQERQLSELSNAHVADIEWLDKLTAMSSHVHATTNEDQVIALILFRTAPL